MRKAIMLAISIIFLCLYSQNALSQAKQVAKKQNVVAARNQIAKKYNGKKKLQGKRYRVAKRYWHRHSHKPRVTLHDQAAYSKATFPKDAVIPSATFINNFVKSNGLSYPIYFIIKSNVIETFLQSRLATPYLHFYLCTNEKTGNDLVITGATFNANNFSYTDQPITVDPNQVLGNLTTSNSCGDIQDPNLEGNYNYLYPQVNLAIVSNTALINTKLASTRINNYEQSVSQFNLAFSFILNTADMLTFLTSADNQYNYIWGQQADHQVMYLQFYLENENNDPNQMSIVMVGLDNQGNHVYYTTDGGVTQQVFNTAFPCPYCNVSSKILTVPSE